MNSHAKYKTLLLFYFSLALFFTYVSDLECIFTVAKSEGIIYLTLPVQKRPQIS